MNASSPLVCHSLKKNIPLSSTLLSLSLALSPNLSAEDQQNNHAIQIHAHPEALTDRGYDVEKLEVLNQAGGASFIDLDMEGYRKVTNLAEAFRFVPGVFTNSNYGSSTISISVRGSGLDSKGFDMNGIRLLEDGIPITTADGRNHNRLINPLSANYATFYRGPSALEYGATVLGGAANFVSPTAYNSPKIQASAIGGSHGYAQARFGAGQNYSNGFDFYVSGDVSTREGYRAHNQQDIQNFYLNTGWQNATIGTRFYFSVLSNEHELPGSLSKNQIDQDPEQANANAVRGDYRKDVDAYRIANKTSFILGESIRLDAGFSYEEQDMWHPIVASATPFFGGLAFEEETQDRNFFARMEQSTEQHKLLYGINYGISSSTINTFDNDDGQKGAQTETGEQDATTLEFYFVDRWSLNTKLTLQLAAQAAMATRKVVDRDATSGAIIAQPDNDYSSFNPRIGLTFSYKEQENIFASVGRVFEPPTLNQLADEAGSNDETLKAMNGINFEIGSRGIRQFDQNSSFSWDLTAFYTAISDEILAVEDPLAAGTAITGNVNKTIHSGLETAFTHELGINAQSQIQSRLSATFNNFAFDSDPLYGNNKLPGAPDYFARAEILYKNSGWSFGPSFDFVGERYVDFANTYSVDSYALLGLLGTYQGKNWRIFIEVRNLLDEDYIVSSSIRDDAIDDNSQILNPGEPRSFYIGAEASW